MLREEKITEKIGKYIPMDCLRLGAWMFKRKRRDTHGEFQNFLHYNIMKGKKGISDFRVQIKFLSES